MSTGLSPTSIFPTSAFYDPNRNPLNIPCEGPRICTVVIDPSIDSVFTVDFTNIITSGKMSCVQYLAIDNTATGGIGSILVKSDLGVAIASPGLSFVNGPIFSGPSPLFTVVFPNNNKPTKPFVLIFSNYLSAPSSFS